MREREGNHREVKSALARPAAPARGGSADAQQARAFPAQPRDGGRGVRRQLLYHRPEPLAVVHVPQMRDFMRRDVVLHEVAAPSPAAS